MPRINPIDPATANGQAKSLLDAVQSKFGMVPNLLATMAHAPGVLQSYLQFNENLRGGTLDATLFEQIAITVSTVNGCRYCVSAHSAMGESAGIPRQAIQDAINGESSDPRTDAALKFARAVVSKQGWVGDDELEAVRGAGFDDSEIAQIIGIVGMKTFTNYFNHIAQTDIDFPEVDIPEPAHA